MPVSAVKLRKPWNIECDGPKNRKPNIALRLGRISWSPAVANCGKLWHKIMFPDLASGNDSTRTLDALAPRLWKYVRRTRFVNPSQIANIDGACIFGTERIVWVVFHFRQVLDGPFAARQVHQVRSALGGCLAVGIERSSIDPCPSVMNFNKMNLKSLLRIRTQSVQYRFALGASFCGAVNLIRDLSTDRSCSDQTYNQY